MDEPTLRAMEQKVRKVQQLKERITQLDRMLTKWAKGVSVVANFSGNEPTDLNDFRDAIRNGLCIELEKLRKEWAEIKFGE